VMPLPEKAEILVIDSGVPRTLAGSGYNQRRAECEEAARSLGVKALRDITDVNVTRTLPEPLQRRARHVVTENNRVLEVLQGVTSERFGELMNASHSSLRDDYEFGRDFAENRRSVWCKTHGCRLWGSKCSFG
jgi:galactokinase